MPTVKQVSILYSVSVILLVIFASRIQRTNTYLGLAITEVFLILPLPLIFLWMFQYDFKKVLRIKKISILNLFLIFCIMAFAIFPVNYLNSYYLLLIKVLFGKVVVASVPPASGWTGLLINIVIIGISAGVCEELLFRGAIMRGLERFGARKAILLTGFLFGLWHMYFTSLFGTFVLGILIGYIVYRTDSIFGGMFAHFCNNSFSVLFGFIGYKLTKGKSANLDIDQTFDKLLNGPTIGLVGYFIGTALLILFFVAALVGLIIAFRATTSDTVQSIPPKEGGKQIKSLGWITPGLVFIGFTWLVLGLYLLNIKISWIVTLAKWIGIS